MHEDSFSYGGVRFLIQKDERGQMKIFRHARGGLVELHGQRAYRVARAYKLKVEKTPSSRKPRVFANKAKRKRGKW
jgi:hypothetical protein